MPRKEWDSSIQDLSVHRISRQEQQARRERMQSPNVIAARRDLERRRHALATHDSLNLLAKIEAENVQDEATVALRGGAALTESRGTAALAN